MILTVPSREQALVFLSLLQDEGIQATILDESGWAAAYGITPPEGIRVQVREEHEERAARLLDSFLSGTFVEASEDPDDASTGESPPEEEGHDARGSSWQVPAAFAVILLALFVLFQMGRSRQDSRPSVHSSGTTYEDLNDDGRPDVWWHYRKGVLYMSESDHNFDGKVDAVYSLTSTGLVKESRIDMNFDGLFEMRGYHESGILSRSEIDVTSDAFPDIVYEFDRGSLVKETAMAHGKVRQIALYARHTVREMLVDTDSDGVFDTRHTFDKFGIFEKAEPVDQPVPAAPLLRLIDRLSPRN